MKDGNFNGYAVDFNEQGEPILIGRYKAGKRVGYWLMPNGHTLSYEQVEVALVCPQMAEITRRAKSSLKPSMPCSLHLNRQSSDIRAACRPMRITAILQ